MKISDVYQKLSVPPNLQEHMLKVCGVVTFIEGYWIGGEEIDWNFIKKAALLHDVGNIVRFDFDNHPEFLRDEQSRVGYWRDVQKQMVEKYSKDDHAATKKILQEVGVDEKLIEIIWEMRFGKSVATRDSNNWPLKIILYADLRTLPLGIGTLEERLHDVRQRLSKYSTRADFKDLVNACRDIEKQIQQKVNIPLEQISDETLEIDSQVSLETEI
ncbi:MAG: hypothetical protein UX88_C0035G0003 [Candidatus Woesebacteria bacterium GW2011_GWC2_47_16]|uniref:HD domain-containing protein n=8 Tax=Candidatus Woeseibacteriota TaxID=1752722 RepID=A0A0G1SN52_9BACT|nr:MAG: hypothetical protein UX03_C0025G0006 [Candidatus Woesebacteria bacterium GW2011_GWE1_45_18]KKU23485.1 MAG: hypothetical protein UX34_C0011G0012 [Candidatus Woesebacteria bacterium GW2011_GWF1_46_13]KKU63225.1 MAG: hypothetical protein UX88_C0035G0003 [Candidatus Woesebacteria bacterium GW2011_GWC2_47_16]KKU70846.1 MAG: hypothetical protein UX95_C0012G0005 [Candidatus Woesebacteria bacterium GW2011_GWD1_47_21]OGM77166.1 MAG: hypothetical protein A2197_01205 [Candidatus Woesebacteria bact